MNSFLLNWPIKYWLTAHTCPVESGFHEKGVRNYDSVVGPSLKEKSVRFCKVVKLHHIVGLPKLALEAKYYGLFYRSNQMWESWLIFFLPSSLFSSSLTPLCWGPHLCIKSLLTWPVYYFFTLQLTLSSVRVSR